MLSSQIPTDSSGKARRKLIVYRYANEQPDRLLAHPLSLSDKSIPHVTFNPPFQWQGQPKLSWSMNAKIFNSFGVSVSLLLLPVTLSFIIGADNLFLQLLAQGSQNPFVEARFSRE
jgi:hypothetical protein